MKVLVGIWRLSRKWSFRLTFMDEPHRESLNGKIRDTLMIYVNQYTRTGVKWFWMIQGKSYVIAEMFNWWNRVDTYRIWRWGTQWWKQIERAMTDVPAVTHQFIIIITHISHIAGIFEANEGLVEGRRVPWKGLLHGLHDMIVEDTLESTGSEVCGQLLPILSTFFMGYGRPTCYHVFRRPRSQAVPAAIRWR